MTGPYDDIIDLEHHVSQCRRRMSISERAAQFSPFAALTGYEEIIRETARLTEEKPRLTEEARAALDEMLPAISPGDEVTVRYFRKDLKKSGGQIISRKACVARVKRPGILVLEDGTAIDSDDILSITL